MFIRLTKTKVTIQRTIIARVGKCDVRERAHVPLDALEANPKPMNTPRVFTRQDRY